MTGPSFPQRHKRKYKQHKNIPHKRKSSDIAAFLPLKGGRRPAGAALDKGGHKYAVGIAVGAAVYLIQQHAEADGGEYFQGLLDGGKVYSGQLAGVDIVKAQQGQLPGDGYSVLRRSLDGAYGVCIGGGKYGGVASFLCEKLLCQLIAVLYGGGGKVLFMYCGLRP